MGVLVSLIQNKYSYGGKSADGTDVSEAVCTRVSAYTSGGDSNVNHYDPGQNLAAKAVWLAGNNDCGASFYKAFAITGASSYVGAYRSAADATLINIGTGSISADVEGGNHTDDTYELLGKGLGGYNQGAGNFTNGIGYSWLNHLIDIGNPSTTAFSAIADVRSPTNTQKLYLARSRGIQYAMDILHQGGNKLNLPKRVYRFQGGTWPADLTLENGDPDPRAGQSWCFNYSEDDWLNGRIFNDVKLAAAGSVTRLPVGRITCR